MSLHLITFYEYVEHSEDLVLGFGLDCKRSREIMVADDADWNGEEGRSTAGFIITFMGMLIADASTSQSMVRSTHEAELYDLNAAM